MNSIMPSIEFIVDFVVRETNERLLRFFNDLEREVEVQAPLARPLVDVSRDFTLRGGKRLRAALALIGYWIKEWGSGDINAILDIMAAIELLQSYLLIHDDIMDRDEMRRGGPTAHVMYRHHCVERGWSDCEHYGISQAITAGDMLEASAVGLLSSPHLPPSIVPQLIATYSRGLRKVAYGQYLDVLLSKLRIEEVREKDVLLVYKLKTSSYTVELPLHLGAIASGSHSERILRELSTYAIPAGIAFQVRDDIIGLYGDPSITGKPAGSDVRSKKKTLLVVKALELASPDEARVIKVVYNELKEREITDEHVEQVRSIVKTSGALDYCERLIKSHVEASLKALEDSVEIGPVARDVLKTLTYRLSYREK